MSFSRWCPAWKLLTAFLTAYLFTVVLLLQHLDIESARNKLLNDETRRGRNTTLFHDPLHKFLFENCNVLHGKPFTKGKAQIFITGDNVPFALPLLKSPPFLEPVLDGDPGSVEAGDFFAIHKEAFIYSAYLDDRKEDVFIRLMMLMSKDASHSTILCHFLNATPREAVRYELCENHNEEFGGYIFSCPIPSSILNCSKPHNMEIISVSYTKSGPHVKIPVTKIRPPPHKLKYLDAYPYSSEVREQKQDNPEFLQKFRNGQKHEPSEDIAKNVSFAICIPPLFGAIELKTFVEFIELSSLLGADHFFFYSFDVPSKIQPALQYYIQKGWATAVPWKLPKDVGRIWYNGQLLAHNDCLYRAMPSFDLVAFNDLDEFIVPHSDATTWAEAFLGVLKEDKHCGIAFQSSFFQRRGRPIVSEGPITPDLIERTAGFSKVRTKVMACPWRIFEIGIHHISKQNREDWTPKVIPPKEAFLHHYRPCISIDCNSWEKDTSIADRYDPILTINFHQAMKAISNQQSPGQ